MIKPFILLLLFSQQSFAKVDFLWSGIAGIYITDGENSLYFDPVFSRPNIPEILLGLNYQVDASFVRAELKELKIAKVDALFIGHTHSDHAIDMHQVAQETGAVIHGSKTAKILATALNVPPEKIQLIKDNDEYQFGKFKVKVLKSAHGLILDIYNFRGGSLSAPLKEKPDVGDYVMGGSYSFLITHPAGNYLVQQSSRITSNIAKEIQGKEFKVIFQGIANRRSTQELFDQLISKASKVEMIFPIHHDNFFLTADKHDTDLLWGIDFDEFKSYTKSINQKIITPEYGKRYTL